MLRTTSFVTVAGFFLSCGAAVVIAAEDGSLDALVAELARELQEDRLGKTFSIAEKVAELKDPAAIPKLIGIIDADNSYKTIYGVGYFGLEPLTGVEHDEVHHGLWWRKWWAANKNRFPKEAQDIPIPTFPLTRKGREFAAHPPDPESIILEPTVDDYVARIRVAIETGSLRAMVTPCDRLAELGDPRAIPKLIGLMDADNSHGVIEYIGGSALCPLTGVLYHPSRHGKWWREWWSVNKTDFPKSAQETAIPDYAKTDHGKEFAERVRNEPVILEPTLDDLLEILTDQVASGARSSDIDHTAYWIASFENPRAIEPLIKLKVIGPLAELTGVSGDESRDLRWWEKWWKENKAEVNRRIDRTVEPPSGNLYVPKHRRELSEGDDVQDISAADTLVGGDERKRYVLIGPKEGAQRPASGWRLLLIMPGGGAGPEFHPFTKRIFKRVLSEEYLAAQIIAPEWGRGQARALVWPTKMTMGRGIGFSTEEQIEAVIGDIRRKHQVDDRFVFTLSWSSSGPAAYAISLQETTRVTGSLIAMSVFYPDKLPPLSRARGHRYFILHSPEDWIKIELARRAERMLKENGATVQFQTYRGGHGWRDDPYGKMRAGIEWLESQAAREDD